MLRKQYYRSNDDHNVFIFNICLTVLITISIVSPSIVDAQTWQKKSIGFSFGDLTRIVIGDGRGDGNASIYAGDENGFVNEFTFSGTSWKKHSFGDATSVTGISIGSGRNDGKKRVYISGYNLSEYYYYRQKWHGREIGPYVQWTNDVTVGKARNDGKNRVYVALWDGIMELTYNNGTWETKKIDTGGASIGRLLVLNGRNDGVLRLYAATDWSDHVYEYTWKNGAWRVADCGASGAIAFYDMAGGKARNDGLNRIYLAANAGGIYELSYQNKQWKYSVVANPAPMGYVGAVAVGKGRSDGVNRVYAWYSPSLSTRFLAEFTYHTKWSITSTLNSTLDVPGIAVGNGRNDETVGVYVAAGDGHAYEFRYPH